MARTENENGFGYFKGPEYFGGKRIDYHWANAALNYALHMNSSRNGLPCDKQILEVAEKGTVDYLQVQWYLRTRGILIREIRINPDGGIEFKVTQFRKPFSPPEPDF